MVNNTIKKMIGSFCLLTIIWIFGYMLWDGWTKGDGMVQAIVLIGAFCLIVIGAIWGFSKSKP